MSLSPRLFFALLAIVFLSAITSAQTRVHTNGVHTEEPSKAVPCQSVSITTSESSLPQTGAPASSPPKTCDHLEQETRLRGAQFELDNLRLENAATQFSGLVPSCDAGIRAAADDGLKRAHALMGTWWWLEGRYFPPLHWYHHPRFWQAVYRTFLTVIVLLAILSLFFYGADIRIFNILRDGWTAFLALTRIKVLWFVDRVPPAAIMTPTDLVTDTKSTLFASLLETSCNEVSHVLERAGGGLQVRATALLSLPSQTASQLVDSMPKIKGVDVAGFVKFFLYLKRYLGWRIESEIGYCPATKQPNGADSAPRFVASASLRRAFWVRGGPWQVKQDVQHPYDVDAVAFALAARIMGFSLRGERAR
jgi:hypothetical protein